MPDTLPLIPISCPGCGGDGGPEAGCEDGWHAEIRRRLQMTDKPKLCTVCDTWHSTWSRHCCGGLSWSFEDGRAER